MGLQIGGLSEMFPIRIFNPEKNNTKILRAVIKERKCSQENLMEHVNYSESSFKKKISGERKTNLSEILDITDIIKHFCPDFKIETLQSKDKIPLLNRRKADQILVEIEKLLKEKLLVDVYLLNEYLDTYIAIDEYDWEAICIYNRLSDVRKLKMKQDIQKIRTSIWEMSVLENIDKISIFKEMKEITREDKQFLKSELDKKEINKKINKKSLEEEVFKKINKLNFDELEFLYRKIEDVTDINESEWDMLIYFTILGDCHKSIIIDISNKYDSQQKNEELSV